MKKKKKAKKGGQTKAIGTGLKGFRGWTDPIASDPNEEREEDMSSLASRLVARMRKRAASS